MHLDPRQVAVEWLVERLPQLELAPAMRHSLLDAGVDAALAERLVTNPPPKLRADWASFVAKAIAGDELWYFHSRGRELDKRAGFALMRAGTPVAAFLTTMS